MKILIFGANGMLGTALHRLFSSDARFETWGTLRSPDAMAHFPESARGRLISGVDVTRPDEVAGAVHRAQPDLVLNAAGIVKQLAVANDPMVAIPVNALFPHQLAALCGSAGARMVHISTDCVFSGRRGGYTEDDQSDAEDLYGRSKFLGEVDGLAHVLTLRTSGIGHENGTRLGLVEWFLGETGRVKGFRKAIYTGFPWVEVARVIRDVVIPAPHLHGLYHVSSEPITKFDLLHLIATVYNKSIEIVPDDEVRIDRSLDSSHFRKATGYAPPPWPELVQLMHANRPTSSANVR